MLVNTCAVRDNAEQRVIGRMGELQRHKRPGDVLGVVGCMAQRLGPALLERVPARGPRRRPRCIPESAGADRARRPGSAGLATPSSDPWEHYEDVPAVRESGPTAFITVQRGLRLPLHLLHRPLHARTRAEPAARGRRRRGRSARRRQGTTEVTLLGQTVNSYHDGRHDFADLLRAVGSVDGLRRLRFTSPYPTDFTPRVIEAMADTPAVCEHVHLPAQSGSNAVLRRMLRRYTRAALSRGRATSSGPPFPASRSRPTSSSASPARPTPSSRKR